MRINQILWIGLRNSINVSMIGNCVYVCVLNWLTDKFVSVWPSWSQLPQWWQPGCASDLSWGSPQSFCFSIQNSNCYHSNNDMVDTMRVLWARHKIFLCRWSKMCLVEQFRVVDAFACLQIFLLSVKWDWMQQLVGVAKSPPRKSFLSDRLQNPCSNKQECSYKLMLLFFWRVEDDGSEG